ncbi:MAG: hypothetical protein AAF570_23440, partial [Bacteroidota bacterium]
MRRFLLCSDLKKHFQTPDRDTFQNSGHGIFCFLPGGRSGGYDLLQQVGGDRDAVGPGACARVLQYVGRR